MFPLFYQLRHNIVAIFSIQNIILQILACIITYLIVTTGFDWTYFKFVHGSSLSTYVSPAVAIGGLIPIFGLPILYVIAKIRKNKNELTIVWALSQAAMLGWCMSSLYKAFTGRVQPPHTITNTLVDMSHDWNFGFMKHGIFWGWPSSHTAVAFAMSFAFISLYPKQKYIFWFALFYAFYIGIGISMQIHWFSEFVAGAIIGAIIGTVVGKSFRIKLSEKPL
jgi:membrane-associated phospholipid phosphatase